MKTTSLINFTKKLISRTWGEEAANTATEYAIMVALILVFCIAAVLSTGNIQQSFWFNTADRVQQIVPTSN